MRKILFVLFVPFVFTSCNEGVKEKETEKENSELTSEKNRQTYAEISVKKGGEWDEEKREYIGGEFQNVSKLEVPDIHTDHSYFIRYEGPGWENQQVGYRLYLDWRNAIDVFGKKVDTLVLPYVGQDGFDSYHNEEDWGMDILKAGSSLGIGSFGRFANDSVSHFREVGKTVVAVASKEGSSNVNIKYEDWKAGDVSTDLNAELSIYPKGRYTKAELKTSTEMEGLCTGIVKFENVPLMQGESSSGEWKYMATYGTQTLVNEEDLLGLAIFYKSEEVEELVEGPHDHLIIFKPSTETKTYYFSAAWEQEKNGIKNQEQFEEELKSKLNVLEEKGQLE